MLSTDVSPFVPKEEPTCIRPFETKTWVTNIGVFTDRTLRIIPQTSHVSSGIYANVRGYGT